MAVDVVSGEQADDSLYVPMYQRIRQTLNQRGLLYVGDAKMGAIESRATIVAGDDWYLMPLAMVGSTPALLESLLDRLNVGVNAPLNAVVSTPTPGASLGLRQPLSPLDNPLRPEMKKVYLPEDLPGNPSAGVSVSNFPEQPPDPECATFRLSRAKPVSKLTQPKGWWARLFLSAFSTLSLSFPDFVGFIKDK